MIAPLPGWSWEVVSGGVDLALQAHPQCAGIRYRERVRPLARFSELLARRARAGRFEASVVGPIKRLVTREGEYAVVSEMTGGDGARRVLAMICGDDWYAEIDGLARCPQHAAEIAEIVEELAFSDCHYLGHRRRRFVYAPPDGWHRYAPVALHALWFPPEYPDRRCLMIVYPALPRQTGAPESPATELELLTTGPLNSLYIVEAVGGVAEVEAAGLDGYTWEYRAEDEHGTPWSRWVTMLRDDHYSYPVFLDAGEDEREAALEAQAALLDSIEPLPQPTAARSLRCHPGLLDHWA